MTDVSTSPPPRDSAFCQLKQYIASATGLTYYVNRDNELTMLIARRLQELNMLDWESYLTFVTSDQQGATELDILIETLTIGETYFFRHRELFDALDSRILPEVLKANEQNHRLRIWSAGCSTGAEAYSVSILLHRVLGSRIRDWDITIIGTDINRRFIALAEQGEYEEWALRGLAGWERQECFLRTNQFWRLKPHFMNGVFFQYHNLATHAFPSISANLCSFDVILCRNVMIYLADNVTRLAIGNFHECLVDGGWLLVGHAEHVFDLQRYFQVENLNKAIAYRKDTRRGVYNNATSQETISSCPRYRIETTPNRVNYLHGHPCKSSVNTQRAVTPDPLVSGPLACVTEPTSLANSFGVLAQIRSLADQGAVESAAADSERLVQQNALNSGCHLFRALLLAQLGKHDQVEKCLRCAIYLDRGNVVAHYYLGLTLRCLGRQQQAHQSLRNALSLLTGCNPNHVIPDSDGLTAAALAQLTHLQLDSIKL